MNSIKNDQLVLVDGSGYIFRAYYALPPMYKSDGVPVNAVFGFCNMLLKLIEDIQMEKGGNDYPIANRLKKENRKHTLFKVNSPNETWQILKKIS